MEKTLTQKDLENRFVEMGKEVNISKAKEIGKLIEKENGINNAIKYLEDVFEMSKKQCNLLNFYINSINIL